MDDPYQPVVRNLRIVIFLLAIVTIMLAVLVIVKVT